MPHRTTVGAARRMVRRPDVSVARLLLERRRPPDRPCFRRVRGQSSRAAGGNAARSPLAWPAGMVQRDRRSRC
jgi:hypothetical protein